MLHFDNSLFVQIISLTQLILKAILHVDETDRHFKNMPVADEGIGEIMCYLRGSTLSINSPFYIAI